MADRRTAPRRIKATRRTAVEGLALVAALTAVFGEIHPVCDQWLQSSRDAAAKGLTGTAPHHLDGTAAPHDTTRRTVTATTAGRIAAARHVASYTAGQVAAAVAVTRAVGYRVPLRHLAAGAAINAATHWIIDRRIHLDAAARAIGKGEYLDHCTAMRREGVVDTAGPGTALMELDQAAHRAIGVVAAVVTTALAIRSRRAR